MKKYTFDSDHFWCTIDRLEAGFFLFSCSTTKQCVQYEAQGEIALVSSTSISPLHGTQRQNQLRDINMALRVSEKHLHA